MRKQQPRHHSSLSSSWPSFLDFLDSDPDRAFAEFYKFANKTLTGTPPRAMQAFNKSEHLDLIHKVVYHCVENHFRILKKYQDKGRPFAGWLYVTANNKCREELRRLSRSLETVSLHGDGDNPGVEHLAIDPSIGADVRAEWADLLSKVMASLQEIDRKCRLLLLLSSDESTILEMVSTLRLPKNQNIKTSNSLRHCRKKLRKLLVRKGVEVVW